MPDNDGGTERIERDIKSNGRFERFMGVLFASLMVAGVIGIWDMKDTINEQLTNLTKEIVELSTEVRWIKESVLDNREKSDKNDERLDRLERGDPR